MAQHKEPFYVMMVDYSFMPASIGSFYQIYKGDWLIFENWGKRVHKLGGYVESPDLMPGDSFQVRIKETGVLKFHCSEYPNMEFEVIVQDGKRAS